MDDICTACLCKDRNLYFIGKTDYYQVYTQILNEIPLHNTSEVCILVCWECRAVLRRMWSFKQQVKDSYVILLQHIHDSKASTTSITREPHLKIHHVHTYTNIPDYIKPDPEVTELPDLDLDKVKSEDVEHLEPETFVNDLLMDGQALEVRSRRKKKDKSTKKKVTNKKGKVKQRRKLSTQEHIPLQNGTSDCNDSDHDNNDLELNEEEIKLDNKNPPTTEDKVEKATKKNESTKKKETNKKGKVKRKRKESTEEYIPVQNGTSDRDTDYDYNDLDMDEEELENELTNPVTEDNKVEKKGTKKEGEETSTIGRRVNGLKARNKESLSEKPQCDECGKVFSSKKTYRYHLNVLHKGQNRYPCPRCGKVYQWKSNLGRHLRSHKAVDSGELYCELCNKRFASIATFRQHVKISRRHVPETEFSFTCDYGDCGKKFVNKTRLRDHIDWEHLNKIKFQCQLCNKPFKCHTSLYVHMQNVHRNKEKKDNLCHVCGKSYQNAAKLKYHIVAMHTSETPYQCAQCDSAFGWYSSLYRHTREVHYKMKVQPKKMKKSKKDVLPTLLSQHLQHLPPGPP